MFIENFLLDRAKRSDGRPSGVAATAYYSPLMPPLMTAKAIVFAGAKPIGPNADAVH
jgi:hypothetical protein